MSSDLFTFDNSFYSDPFPTFAVDQPVGPNPFEEIQENHDPLHEKGLSSSPAGAQLENLSLSQQEKTEYSLKIEECQLGLDTFYCFENCFSPQSTVKFMQSYRSSFGKKQDFTVWPHFNSAQESPENGFRGGGQTRRVCSTGDLQKAKTNMQKTDLSASTTGKPLMEDSNLKVERYSAVEKKERIDRYRAKRTQRNFNKTIKYACRKTLAESRPRIRGRFARNDEAGEIRKASLMFTRYEEDEDVWIEGFEDDHRIDQRQMFFNINAGSTQYHNYSF